jgi:recombination protein RecT
MNTTTQTSGNGGALVKKDLGPPPEPVAAMKYWITKSQGAFGKILPKHLTAERFVKVAHASITKNPKLALCEPKDIVMALIQCSEMGLEPNTPLHHVHLIPFKNGRASKQKSQELGRKVDVYDVQVIVGFEGYLDLIYRSGKILSLSSNVIYETDEYDYDLGSKPFIHHKPNLKIRSIEQRGSILAAYLTAQIDGGGTKVELMPYADIVDIRDRSQGYKYAVQDGKDHPWISSFAEMAKKTAIRRGQKQMPKRLELADALARAAEIDARSEGGRKKVIDVDFEVVNELPVGLGISSGDTQPDEDDRDNDAPEPTVEKTPEVTTATPAATASQGERLKEQAKSKRGGKTPPVSEPAKASPEVEKGEAKPAEPAKRGWEDLAIGDQWKDPKGKLHIVIAASPNLFPLGKTVQEMDEPPADEEREPGSDG